MNLSENLNNSFNFAKKLSSDGGRLIILVIFYLPIFVPILNSLAFGYLARVLREAPASNSPPTLGKYADMFTDGLKVSLAIFIYTIVPMSLIAFGVVSMGVGVFGSEPTSLMLGGFGVVLLLVGSLLAFVFSIFLDVGIAHMVKTEKFGKAFAFGEILGVIGRIGWVKYIGWAIVTAIIAFLVVGLAGSIPYVGWLLSAVISPFLFTFIFRSLGDLYNDGASPELRVTDATVVGTGVVAATPVACSSCGAHLQPHHKFCPACGAPAPVPTVDGSKFCIACGAHIPTTAVFCGSCGAKQN